MKYWYTFPGDKIVRHSVGVGRTGVGDTVCGEGYTAVLVNGVWLGDCAPDGTTPGQGNQGNQQNGGGSANQPVCDAGYTYNANTNQCMPNGGGAPVAPRPVPQHDVQPPPVVAPAPSSKAPWIVAGLAIAGLGVWAFAKPKKRK